MITNLNDIVRAFSTKQVFYPLKYTPGASSAVIGYWNSSWRTPGSNLAEIPPTGSGEACGASTLGRVMINDAGPAKELYMSRLLFSPSAAVGCYVMDRLVHTSGLSGTITTAQAVNTVALPSRANNGEGAEIWLEWYVTTGATARIVTVTYTNSNNVTGRTATVSLPVSVRATSTIRVPLQAGDTGVKSVQTVSLNGSTGTAGNFGVTIANRISTIDNVVANAFSGVGPIGLNLPKVPNGSCLFFIVNSATTTAARYDLEMTIIEG